MIQLLLAYALKSALLLALTTAAIALSRSAPAVTRHKIGALGLAAAVAMLPLSMAMPQLHLDFVAAQRAGLGLNLLVFLWLGPASLLLVMLGFAQIRLARLRRSTLPVDDPRLIEACRDSACRMGVTRRVAIGAAPGPMPMTFGWLRPIILIPRDAARWPAERLNMTMMHEMAHVARGDSGILLLAGLARALLWFNPLAWRIASRIAFESERACDDLVLAAGASPSSYGRALLDAARDASGGGGAVPLGAIGMAGGRDLETRLVAILVGDSKPRPPASAWPSILQVLTIGAMICLAPLRAEGSSYPYGAQAPTDGADYRVEALGPAG